MVDRMLRFKQLLSRKMVQWITVRLGDLLLILSDLSITYHILGSGQSGHMKSEWFHNQVDDWVQGNYHETVLDGEIKEDSTLLLKSER